MLLLSFELTCDALQSRLFEFKIVEFKVCFTGMIMVVDGDYGCWVRDVETLWHCATARNAHLGDVALFMYEL